jgi:hypothetical protein
MILTAAGITTADIPTINRHLEEAAATAATASCVVGIGAPISVIISNCLYVYESQNYRLGKERAFTFQKKRKIVRSTHST